MEKGFTKFLQGKRVMDSMQNTVASAKKPETPGLEKMEKYLLNLSESISKGQKSKDISAIK